jgi:diacylglycerol kinase (ATP)
MTHQRETQHSSRLSSARTQHTRQIAHTVQISASRLLKGALAAGVGAALLWAHLSRQHRSQVTRAINDRPQDPVEYAFVVNPSKPGAQEVIAQILQFCKDQGIPRPLIIKTRLDKDGTVCTKEALAKGAQVVVAVGGDGTVRTVAAGLANTGHAMGVVPIGTANLFARNLGIPLDVNDALKVVVSHGSTRVDMGKMTLMDARKARHREHWFLLISGIGFDANMIRDTNPNLKKKMGWLAYIGGAVKHLFGRKESADISITDAQGVSHTYQNIHFRTFLIGNCGQIPLVSLMPEADYSDGLLDFELIDTDGGIIGWANLANDVVHQTIRGRSGQRLLSIGSTLRSKQGTHAELRFHHPALAEVDGDMLTHTRHVVIDCCHQALIVRVPRVEA